jgi:hypothetical protein
MIALPRVERIELLANFFRYRGPFDDMLGFRVSVIIAYEPKPSYRFINTRPIKAGRLTTLASITSYYFHGQSKSEEIMRSERWDALS